jgi:hypothetical protein
MTACVEFDGSNHMDIRNLIVLAKIPTQVRRYVELCANGDILVTLRCGNLRMRPSDKLYVKGTCALVSLGE